MSNYMISILNNEAATDGIIHDVKSKLKVRASIPLKPHLTPKAGEVQFFVTSGDQTIAFETRGYNKHREVHIIHMISRYCVYLGLMEARIHQQLPVAV